MEQEAFAKINLSLDITGRREDGFHTLDTVMQSVSLSDRVRLELDDTGEIALTCSKPHIPCDARNTAFRAAQLFLDATGLAYGARIHIEKRIPDEAGLGGGSADAAAVLRMLNALTGEPLNTAELLFLAMRVGADVPFCVLNGTRRCGGIGEEMIPLAPMAHCGILLVKPPVGVSTPAAYRRCDEAPDDGVRYTGALVRAIEARDFGRIASSLGNRFDDALRLPEVEAIKERLRALGALGAQMTGSGSAVFGLFETEDDARRACAALGERYGAAFVAHPVRGE